MQPPPSMRMIFYGSRSEHSLDDSPLDLAPRRLIAPRRRLRELSTDHTINSALNLLPSEENSMDQVISRMQTLSSDLEQPESPPVITFL